MALQLSIPFLPDYILCYDLKVSAAFHHFTIALSTSTKKLLKVKEVNVLINISTSNSVPFLVCADSLWYFQDPLYPVVLNECHGLYVVTSKWRKIVFEFGLGGFVYHFLKNVCLVSGVAESLYQLSFNVDGCSIFQFLTSQCHPHINPVASISPVQ